MALSDGAFKVFSRHLVALGVTAITEREEREGKLPRFLVYPGTLICLRDNIFFLTAGHNVAQIKEGIEGGAKMVAKLNDTFGLKKKSDALIPFDLNPDQMFFVDDEKLGLDFGLILLTRYYHKLLLANNPMVLFENNWIKQDIVKFDRYAMCGPPAEFMPSRLADFDARTIEPVFFTVTKLEKAPLTVSATTYERFIARIEPSDAQIKSVKGMSGCPIFGLKREGDQLRYWLVAIQSSWLESERVIFGCPIPLIASLVNKWTDDAESS